MTDSHAAPTLRRPRLAATALLVLSRPPLAACGEKSEDATGAATEPFSLTLDFYPNPDHAGIYMAEKRGYFRDAGLDVSIQTPPTPRRRSSRSPPGRPTWRSPTSPRCCWRASRAST